MRKELIILSGFLGSGKTTLLRSLLLRHSDRKIAVLLNDFGDIPVDGETLRRSGVEGGVVVEIGGGSVFCSCLREPFIKALANLAARDEDLIIVEASGMSDPSAVDKMLRLSGLDHLPVRSRQEPQAGARAGSHPAPTGLGQRRCPDQGRHHD